MHGRYILSSFLLLGFKLNFSFRVSPPDFGVSAPDFGDVFTDFSAESDLRYFLCSDVKQSICYSESNYTFYSSLNIGEMGAGVA
jgi:hypothetical protein